MSNPIRVIKKQIQRSAEDISDEWKRMPSDLRNVITVGAVAGGAVLIGGAVMGSGAAAGGAGAGAGAGGAAMGGTGIGVGTGTLAAAPSATAAAGGVGLGMGGAQMAAQAPGAVLGGGGGGGLLGTLGSGLKAGGNALLSGVKSAGGFLGNMSPAAQAAAITTGGKMLQGAMTPDPIDEIDILNEQRRLRDADSVPVGNFSGGGYLGPPQQAYTTPQPVQRFDPMEPYMVQGANQAAQYIPYR